MNNKFPNLKREVEYIPSLDISDEVRDLMDAADNNETKGNASFGLKPSSNLQVAQQRVN